MSAQALTTTASTQEVQTASQLKLFHANGTAQIMHHSIAPGPRVAEQLPSSPAPVTRPRPLSRHSVTNHAAASLPGFTPVSYQRPAHTIDAEDQASAAPVSWPFQMDAPFWQRLWFRALALVSTAVAAGPLSRWRFARLLAAERLRLRIAEDLHDDLGSSLSQIAVLSAVAHQRVRNQDEASDPESTLRRIGELAREAALSLTDIVWSLDPQWDSVQDLVARLRLFGNDLLADQQIRFVVQMPEHLEKVRLRLAVRREIFLIVKEALHNVVRHARAQNVTLRIGATRTTLEIRMEDDGCGFDSDAVSAGHGLCSMRKRAAQARGVLTMESAPGCGTRLQLHIPLQGS